MIARRRNAVVESRFAGYSAGTRRSASARRSSFSMAFTGRVNGARRSYSTGVTNRVSSEAMPSPPMTTMPIAARLSAPAPVASTSGTAPRMVETTVMTIGRRRIADASSTASRIERPSSRS